jgi:queuine tRNA-ribosyltransferase
MWQGSENVSKWKGVDEPIEVDCGCWTCKHVSRAALFHMKDTPMCGQLLSLHNVEFQNRLTKYFREGIKCGALGKYEKVFFRERFQMGIILVGLSML